MAIAAFHDASPTGLPTRLRRSWHLFFSGRQMVELLREQADELRDRYEALATARAHLQREIAAAHLREQRRIADDIDARLGCHLEAVAAQASRLAATLAPEHPALAQRATALADHLHDATALARELARGLDPLREGAAALPVALDQLAARTARLCGVSCEFHRLGDECALDPIAALHLYRIAQEALNNAVRHGHASRVRILLTCAEGILSLAITDNGAGLSPAVAPGSCMGLRVMEYRARSCGGLLRIDTTPGGGASIASVIDTAAIARAA